MSVTVMHVVGIVVEHWIRPAVVLVPLIAAVAIPARLVVHCGRSGSGNARPRRRRSHRPTSRTGCSTFPGVHAGPGVAVDELEPILVACAHSWLHRRRRRGAAGGHPGGPRAAAAQERASPVGAPGSKVGVAARSRRMAARRAAKLHAGSARSSTRRSAPWAGLAAAKARGSAGPAGRGAAGGAGPVAWPQRPPAPSAAPCTASAAPSAAAPRRCIGARPVDSAATLPAAAAACLAAELA